MPAKTSERAAVVPVTAVYGANASGKSSLLDGLRFMRRAVVESFQQWDAEGSVPRFPFRLAPGSREQPSVFAVEIVVDGVPYDYGFRLDDERILEEWLYSYPEKRPRLLFERTEDRLRFGSTVSGELKSRLTLLGELTRPNSLFLSTCAQVQMAELMPVYRWFRFQLKMRMSATYSTRRAVDYVVNLRARKPQLLERLVELLRVADVGITGFAVEETEDPARQVAEKRRELHFLHGQEDERFTLEEESAGTRSWLALLPIVLEALDDGHVVAVDEIDTSLHPLLTVQLVNLFRNPDVNQNGAQLIFTSHDSSLLGPLLGQRALERDEIWFVEKQGDGASSLYPLSDFKPREEHNNERRYLGGSYGAVPVLDPDDFAEAVRPR
ncbi:hypothetical protein HNR02_002077 [Amycolatopsis endophytica]|uniref:ATPase AAA-type core domain-containing protein n=1 Tax=Amycolatopsis endophytica TaxID=860233 RepID=A0A853B1P7_9PSEU|nr:ATP-binding protein [Amycolatopsis endophytica]NYI88754.1 hypothetical protein [Amycolatopsis endophytica]